MVDGLSKERRSWNMSRIKSKDTAPEMCVRKVLYGLGYRYRLHDKRVFGKPDIILPKYKTAIFVHGCFWHRHSGCRYAYTPKSRSEFWSKKFEANTARDKVVADELDRINWRRLVIWECQTKSKDKIGVIIKDFFRDI